MEFIAKVLQAVSGLLWFTKEPDAAGIVGFLSWIFKGWDRT